MVKDKRKLGALTLFGLLVVWTVPVTAACEARSGPITTALLELYTSEGCSSCPPADRWTAALPQKGFSQDRLVPLAFHVDYWNYLGWVDPFAQHKFTQRQHEFAQRTNATTVYTPEVVLSGKEYRRWWFSSFDNALRRINQTPPGADIVLRLNQSGKTLKVDGEATLRKEAGAGELYIALYENNLSSNVGSGENSGKRLDHQFVVRHLLGPMAFDTAGKASFNEQFTLNNKWKTKDLGVATFVQQSRGSRILQALALDVCS